MSQSLQSIEKNKKKVVENLLTSKKDSNEEIPFPLPSNSLPPLGSSDILSRVQAFLPQIKSANEQLEKQDTSKLNIENVDEDQQYIEMNLGLGVYDLKKPGDNTDDSSEEEGELMIPTTSNNNTNVTDKKKPLIEMMDQEE